MTGSNQHHKLPISVILIIRNEEPVIARCLKSCADLVDEIIVIHDGLCHDRSLEICRQFTDQVYVEPFTGDPGCYRVQALQQTNNNWILLLDADEFLSDELRQQLPRLINDPRYQGYNFLWPTWRHGRYYYAYHKRALVDKRYFYLIGIGHEYLKPVQAGVAVLTVPFILEHKPLHDNLTFSSFRTKWLPWVRRRAQSLNQPFSTFATFNCPLTSWEPRMRYRLKYPLTLGLIGSFIVHNLLGLYYFLTKRRWIFLKSGFLVSLYHATLYYYIWKLRRQTDVKPGSRV